MTVQAVLARRFRFLPPRAFAIVMHLVFQGELSTLRHPESFAELLAAKNLRPQDPLVPLTADKYAVRSYVADKVGERYLIPLLQVVDRAEDLDDAVLAQPCVVKATHGCDMTMLLPDAGAPDRAEVEKTVRRWLATDFHRSGWREAPYRGLPRRTVVESYIGDAAGPPPDVKFYMFHGHVGMVQIDHGRFGDRTSNLVDERWRELGVHETFPAAPLTPPPPERLDEMIAVAQALSTDFEFARIDLYDTGGRVLFGEITHYPGGGVASYRPRAFNRAVGELWRHGTPLPDRFVRRP